MTQEERDKIEIISIVFTAAQLMSGLNITTNHIDDNIKKAQYLCHKVEQLD